MDILVIPDTQCKRGVNLDHLRALGNYIVQRKPDYVVHLGDHWDMHSLNAYDKPGSKSALDYGNYKDDIEAGHEGMKALMTPIQEYNRRKIAQKKKGWYPVGIFLMGNHENRINRFLGEDVRREGMISVSDLRLEEYGWKVIPFLSVYSIENIHFSHYFINPTSALKGVLSGTIENRLKALGFSFVQGHQQTFQYGSIYDPRGVVRKGLVCGACYSHDEGYMGTQGNHHYRGAFHLHDVTDGDYRLEELPLTYLIKEYL